MGVEGVIAVAVVDDHVVAVGVVVAEVTTCPLLQARMGVLPGAGMSDAGVAVGLAGDGVDAVAEQGGQPVVARQGPQIAGLRVDGDVVLPPLLLQLLLLLGDLRLDFGGRLALRVSWRLTPPRRR